MGSTDLARRPCLPRNRAEPVELITEMPIHSSPVNDPAYWRQRAEEARALADQLDEPVTKQIVLTIAEGYEQVAALAAARLLAHEPE